MPDAFPSTRGDTPASLDLVVAPRGRGWALAALAVGGVGIGTGEFAPMGLLPDISRGVDVSITTAGHAISAYALGVVVGAPAFAVLAANVPRRALLVALMLVFTLGNVLSALAPTYDTLIVARFLSGLPHGAFFGIASLVAASMVEPGRRTWAVGQVMLGLSIANIACVPAITWLGQALSWRSAFGFVAALGLLTAALVLRFAPDPPVEAGAGMRRELGALRRPQVLLTLGVGAIGFGGMFAVYSYISPIMTVRAGLPTGLVPLVLTVWGVGMLIGNVYGTRLIDRWPVGAMYGVLVAFAVFLGLFAIVSTNPIAATAMGFLIGTGVVLGPALQTRLMDVAGDSQTLAATMNHAAFNFANATGAFVGGVAFDATGSWASPAVAGVGLSLGGLLLLGASSWVAGRTARRRVVFD